MDRTTYGRAAAMIAGTLAWPMAASAQSANTPSTTAESSLQASFDQASAIAAAGDCEKALPLFERLAANPRLKAGSLAAATVSVRRGVCLFRAGRLDEAEAQVLSGLPKVRQAGSEMTGDVVDAEMTLAAIAAGRFDHDGAVAHYTAALAVAPEADRPLLHMRLAQVTQFDGGSVALDHLDAAAAILAKAAKPDRKSLANIRTVRGRVLMAQGRNKEALAELRQALSLSGGLTTRISLSEAAMRGDLAQAALLNGQGEQARLYLSYTGAGRIQQSPFATAKSMAPPACGPETGLTPDDVAIVEFGIADSGDVSNATTVYTRGDYAVAAAFARAVRQWYWLPADLTKIPPFYRVLTRVELRCSREGGEQPAVADPLRERFATWATPYLGGVALDDTGIGAGRERLAAVAKQKEAAGDTAGLAAVLTARALLNLYYDPTAFADLDRAATLAAKAGIAAEPANAIVVFRAMAETWRQNSRLFDVDGLDRANTVLTRDPRLNDDALAADTLVLAMTPSAPTAARRSTVWAALVRVADDKRLPDHHPLRQLALLRLANLAAGEGKLDVAQGYFTRTGLTEEQCALIGARPVMKATGSSSGDFPMEAMRYGFEGWVNLEFDINANGTTARARPMVAYPPFVFVNAATGMARDFRYQASYRPSGALGCSAERQTVRFLLPDLH